MVRKIRAKLVLQLRAEGLSGRAIAASQGMSRRSITDVIEAADVAGLGWENVADLPDGEVYSRLFRVVASMRACSLRRTGIGFIANLPASG